MNTNKNMEAYNRLMFGGNYELVRVKEPLNGVKAESAESSFVFAFLREIPGKTTMPASQKQKKSSSKGRIKPGDNINIKDGGCYIRRAAAAKYLGISPRTLSNWQRRCVIPVVQVGHRITLFKKAELDRCLKRFTLKAAGDDV